ncbi:MAG: hypothetical protein RLZ98_3742 [Pseudomonadota bacterium]|jgi:hypothetical protein
MMLPNQRSRNRIQIVFLYGTVVTIGLLAGLLTTLYALQQAPTGSSDFKRAWKFHSDSADLHVLDFGWNATGQKCIWSISGTMGLSFTVPKTMAGQVKITFVAEPFVDKKLPRRVIAIKVNNYDSGRLVFEMPRSFQTRSFTIPAQYLHAARSVVHMTLQPDVVTSPRSLLGWAEARPLTICLASMTLETVK